MQASASACIAYLEKFVTQVAILLGTCGSALNTINDDYDIDMCISDDSLDLQRSNGDH